MGLLSLTLWTNLSPWPSTPWLGRWQVWWRRYGRLRLPPQILQHSLQHLLLLHLLLLLLSHLLLLHFLLLLHLSLLLLLLLLNLSY